MSAEQPTILPWHREAAHEVQSSGYLRVHHIAAIIARHDPSLSPLFTQRVLVPKLEKQIADLKAQHAETLRLLEALEAAFKDFANESECKLTQQISRGHAKHIRAHLAAQGGGK